MAALAYCDDCGTKHGLPIDDLRAKILVPGFYGKCGRCGLIRACYGQDPDPQKPRRAPVPPAVQEWQRGRDYRR